MLQVKFCLDGWDCRPFAPKPNDYQKVFFLFVFHSSELFVWSQLSLDLQENSKLYQLCHNLNIWKLQQFWGNLLNTTPFLLCISFHSILKKEDKKNVCNDLTKDSSIILWNVLGFPSFVTWASTPYMLQYIAAKVQFRLGLYRPNIHSK